MTVHLLESARGSAMPPALGRRLRVSMNIVVVALAVWVAWLTIQYVFGTGVTRFRLESAVFWFSAGGLLVRLAHDRFRTSPRAVQPASRLPPWTLLLWWCSAIVLYAPILRIGFLSDDFVLADHAASGHIGLFTPEMFRPVPLIVWAAILHAGGGPISLHLLNVLLHGTNAYLAARLAEPYVDHVVGLFLAGALVIAFPLSPEAVAWAAGVFDVMAAAFVLLGMLVARSYGSLPSTRRRAALYGCAALALLSKETAAVLPLLILLDMWAMRRHSRPLAVDACVLMIIILAIASVRLQGASPMMKQPITPFMAQRWLFATLGGIAFPWHVSVLHGRPLIVLVATLTCIGFITAFFVGGGPSGQTRAVVMMVCLMLIATLPVMMILVVAPDLQGARYLYLPSIGWAGFVACVTCGFPAGTLRRCAVLGAIVLIATYAANTPIHLAPWRRAGELRDQVERALATNSMIAGCRSIQLSNLPDNVDGAYVFRNGAAEALRLDVHVYDSVATSPKCSFAWDKTRADFVPTTR